MVFTETKVNWNKKLSQNIFKISIFLKNIFLGSLHKSNNVICRQSFDGFLK